MSSREKDFIERMMVDTFQLCEENAAISYSEQFSLIYDEKLLCYKLLSRRNPSLLFPRNWNVFSELYKYELRLELDKSHSSSLVQVLEHYFEKPLTKIILFSRMSKRVELVVFFKKDIFDIKKAA